MLTEISRRLKLTIFWATLDIIWSIGQFKALFFTYRKGGEDFVCQQCDLWSSKVFDKGGGRITSAHKMCHIYVYVPNCFELKCSELYFPEI